MIDAEAFPELFEEFATRRLADLGAQVRLYRLVTSW